MSDNPHHPYSFEVQAGPKPDTFQWVIRERGKLIQRSDKLRASEERARADAEQAIQLLLGEGPAPRRR